MVTDYHLKFHYFYGKNTVKNIFKITYGVLPPCWFETIGTISKMKNKFNEFLPFLNGFGWSFCLNTQTDVSHDD